MAGVRQIVDSPALTPLPYGLLSVVDFPTPSDVHWQNGITYTSRCPIDMGSLTYDECITVTGAGGAPPAPAVKVANIQSANRGATPFTVYTEFDCSPVGNENPQDAALRALLAVESWQVERAVWSGQLGNAGIGVYPHLASPSGTTVVDAQGIVLQAPMVTGGSATTDVAEALGILERMLADCYGGVGVIHVPIAAVPTLDAWGLIKTTGARLRTLNGNLVAAGAGYPGTAPDGTAPAAGTSWMYATGAIFAYRGPARAISNLSEAIDRGNNTIKMIAERTYVVGWECCQVGVLFQLGVPVT